MITYKELFGLTAREKRLLAPLPPGATTVQLVDRLKHLGHLREEKFIKMEAPETRVIDIVRYQAEVTLISAAMEATTFRARTAWIRAAAWPPGREAPLKAWLDEYLKRKGRGI
jgi:hypothetical protein